jgi:hypothetical protein
LDGIFGTQMEEGLVKKVLDDDIEVDHKKGVYPFRCFHLLLDSRFPPSSDALPMLFLRIRVLTPPRTLRPALCCQACPINLIPEHHVQQRLHHPKPV